MSNKCQEVTSDSLWTVCQKPQFVPQMMCHLFCEIDKGVSLISLHQETCMMLLKTLGFDFLLSFCHDCIMLLALLSCQ